jgi:hypothetical protein
MSDNVQGKRFPGYGRCIYCGSTGVLKDEHIIPFSLGGNAVIKNASCGQCETSYLDGYLARSTYNEYRAHVGLKSRRSKERPTSLPATFVKPDGTQEVRMFAAKDQPYFLMMPIWHLPGIASGKVPSAIFEIMQAHAYEYIPADLKKSAEMHDEQIRAEGQINYSAFARAIARISYCTAVSYLGLDGFDRMDLPALILGTYPSIPHYVGVMRNDPEPPGPHGSMHRIDIQEYTQAGNVYWLVSLRLFSHSSFENNGMPIYRTIVGRKHA